jgi:hypothetical protein
MLNEVANKVNPKVLTAIKITAIALTAVAGVIIVGVVLNKMGLVDFGTAEELAEVAASAAN